MNTETTVESQAVAQAAELVPSTAVTLAQRAAVALGESANAAKLRDLVSKSAGIVAVTNQDGREEAHRAGMVLLKTRTSIAAKGKAAREDATAFSKSVIALEKELIAIVEPEENRVLALRDAFDVRLAEEKAAKAAAERARIDAIKAAIAEIKDLPLQSAGMPSADIELAASDLQDRDISADFFAEFVDEAKIATTCAIAKLRELASKAAQAEQAAREAEEARLAEVARIEADRAELARQRAENEHIAAEQAAEAKRLADLAAEQELAARRQRDADAAERDRLARMAAQRLADEQAAANAEQARVAAENKRQIEAQQAQIAADRRASEEATARAAAELERKQVEFDARVKAEEDAKRANDAAVAAQSADTDAIAAECDAWQADDAERERLQALANLAVADAHAPIPTLEELAADLIDAGPDDFEILDVVAVTFGLTHAEAIERLVCMDLVALRARVAA